MKRPENLTKTILHGLTAAFGILILGFLALPYLTISAGAKVAKSGYDFLDFSTPNPTSEQTFCAVVVLLLVIFACVLIVSAALSLLCDTGIVSNEKFAKAVKWLSLISAVIVFALAVLNIVACTNLVSATNKSFAAMGITPASASIAGLVLNLLCAGGATACTLYSTIRK